MSHSSKNTFIQVLESSFLICIYQDVEERYGLTRDTKLSTLMWKLALNQKCMRVDHTLTHEDISKSHYNHNNIYT